MAVPLGGQTVGGEPIPADHDVHAAASALGPRVDSEVLAALAQGSPVEALVSFDDRPAEAAISGERRRRGLAETDASLIDLERATRASVKQRAGPLTVVRDYPHLPVQLVRFSSPGEIDDLLKRPGVLSIARVGQRHTLLAESLPLINQPQAAAAGYIGAGVSVAVVDTGVDYLAPGFDCTGLNAPAGTCKVIYAQDFAPEDGQRDANGHGTNVAGIVVGVAPGARIIALDVFQGDIAYDPDILAALDWVVANRATYNIRAVNLSLGDSSHFTSPCVSSFATSAFAALRSAGVVPVVAAGNLARVGSSFVNGLADPACAPGALSVGAVYDAVSPPLPTCWSQLPAPDVIACFSQSAFYLTALAPGSQITAAGRTMSGTSQAAPHAAGLIAVLASANPGVGVDGWQAALATTGKPILDTRNGVTKRRIDVYQAVCSLAPCSGPTATASASPTPSPTASATPTPSATTTRVPAQQPSATPAPSATPTHVPTQEPSATPAPSATPTHVPTQEPSATPAPSATPTATPAPRWIQATNVLIVVATPTATVTATPTPSPTAATSAGMRIDPPGGSNPLRAGGLAAPD